MYQDLRTLKSFYCLAVVISKRSTMETTTRADLECEFPPKMEEDLTHLRRKRLTTETGLVCLEDYPYTVSVR